VQIIVDTREQQPLWDLPKTTLIVGDYTTKRLHGKFHIERKTLADLYSTITSGNKRFKYELFRAAYNQIKLEVYVEGTYDAFINKRFPKGSERKFTMHGLEELIKTLSRKYYLHFEWCKNRADCQKKVENRLKVEEKLISGPKRHVLSVKK